MERQKNIRGEMKKKYKFKLKKINYEEMLLARGSHAIKTSPSSSTGQTIIINRAHYCDT